MTQPLEWKKAVSVDIPEDEEWDPNKYDWANAGQVTNKVEQPLYKWSYDGHQLTIWPVNDTTGRPHHIEVTGLEFYRLAQGRVYRDKEGNLEILVWEDRGTPEMQDEAIEAVENYLKNKLGEAAAYYSFQTEGDVYGKQDPNNPNWDEIMSAYFQTPVKTRKQPFMDRMRGKPYDPLKGLLY